MRRNEVRDHIHKLAREQPDCAYHACGYIDELKPSGADLVGLCPFREERNPSFHITAKGPYAGRCKCFGCGFGGDLFTFVMRVQRCDFPTWCAMMALTDDR